MDEISSLIVRVAEQCGTKPTFDMLAEEVLELHLAIRRKHEDPPILEWLEIAVLVYRKLKEYGVLNVQDTVEKWETRHATR